MIKRRIKAFKFIVIMTLSQMSLILFELFISGEVNMFITINFIICLTITSLFGVFAFKRYDKKLLVDELSIYLNEKEFITYGEFNIVLSKFKKATIQPISLEINKEDILLGGVISIYYGSKFNVFFEVENGISLKLDPSEIYTTTEILEYASYLNISIDEYGYNEIEPGLRLRLLKLIAFSKFYNRDQNLNDLLK